MGSKLLTRKNPHAVALGRLGGLVGGKVTSEAKVCAARENGKLGGRPTKAHPIFEQIERIKKLRDETLEEVDVLGEMATFSPSEHRLGFNLKLHVYQEGDRKLPHGPRLKVFRRSPKEDGSFFIKIGIDLENVEFDSEALKTKPFLSQREINQLVEKIRKYRKAFLFLTKDTGLSATDTRKIMDVIDQGRENELPKYPIEDWNTYQRQLSALGIFE